MSVGQRTNLGLLSEEAVIASHALAVAAGPPGAATAPSVVTALGTRLLYEVGCSQQPRFLRELVKFVYLVNRNKPNKNAEKMPKCIF